MWYPGEAPLIPPAARAPRYARARADAPLAPRRHAAAANAAISRAEHFDARARTWITNGSAVAIARSQAGNALASNGDGGMN